MLPTDIHKILAVCFCCCHFFGNYFWPNAKLKVNAVASHPNTEDDDNNDGRDEPPWLSPLKVLVAATVVTCNVRQIFIVTVVVLSTSTKFCCCPAFIIGFEAPFLSNSLVQLQHVD